MLESRRQFIRLEVAQGAAALDRGDSTLAMLWFADALGRDDPARSGAHRLRLGMAAREAPQLHEIWFHQGAVRQARFNAEGSKAVTVAEDGTARIWDLKSFAAGGKPLVHPAAVVDASFGKEDLLVTACADGSGRIWDTARGLVVAFLSHQAPLTCAQFDPAGTKVLTASKDGTARLCSTDGRLLSTLVHSGPINHAAFGAGGRLVVTASDDRTARVWESQRGTPVTPPLRHDGRVAIAALSPDGKLVATAAHDVAARMWPVRNEQSTPQRLEHKLPVTCLAFSPDGSRLATGSADATVRIWDPVTAKPAGPILRHDSAVLGISYHPDGHRLATCSDDNACAVVGHRHRRAAGGPVKAWRKRLVHCDRAATGDLS